MLEASQSNKLIFNNESLKKENHSLRFQNRALKGCVLGVLALNAVLAGYSYRTACNLNKTRSENTGLQQRVTHFQKDSADLFSENQKLKNYADDAQNFALGIRPLLDENDFGCEDPNCTKCKKMEKENDKKLDEFSKAMDTLNIDEEVLSRLQEGWQRQ